jgi:exo-beta-1,3-glucanase (GH17 family)/cellulose synthase/poly-beta-1,6-N-acetylglucosamine synthase-like glycosyltransferase
MRFVVAVVALVSCAHAAVWALSRDQSAAPDVAGPLASVSYAPFADSEHPDRGQRATAQQIRADLRTVAPYTRAIRTYSSTGGVELVPPIADELDLKVTVGAWIDRDEARNTREMRSAIDLARKNRNVNALVVGNETIYRGEQTIDQLIKLIQHAKREVQVPVTTGEIWHVWLEHPELASSVDFIAAHILPYWEGFSADRTVDQTILIYDKLRQAFPGKRIVVAEFGWPSAGYNLKNGDPGRMQQAVVLRDFVSHAEALGIDYNIVEAVDQPWKAFEGSVGPYWGLLDASRQTKFHWTGPIVDPDHWKLAAIAVLTGFLLSLPILTLAAASIPQAVLLAGSVHVIGAWIATIFAYWNGHYFVPGAAFALGFGLLLLGPLVVIALARVEEIAAIAFGAKPRRLIAAAVAAPPDFVPKVSIHVPACREPPEMLKLTLDAVARLNYPNFECVVVVNNTPDPALWRPVEDHCRELGERFKFVNAETLPGFKAGALRLAGVHTAADAQIIGILDADYVVHADWLKDLVPVFADPTVGLIQAPQDHRDGARSVMHHVMNGEYAGFFDVGMVQRNENNAIIVHGTMCLIRRAAIEAAGGWSSDTIVEDTDLGLSILEHGWRALYTNRRYGWGLLPNTFEAFKKQRYRWASGGAQIIKKHWRLFLPGASLLSSDQKREFAVGWLNWLGAETVGVTVALLNLLWVPVVAFVGIAIPDKILTLPIIAAFVVSVVHFVAVYRLRVAIPIGQAIGAMFTAMAVQWTVARAVGDGLIKRSLPFVRTAKGAGKSKAREFQAFWETILGVALLIGAAILLATNRQQIREIYIFAAVLVLQSLPFLSALAIAALEGARINDFAYWRRIEARIAELIPRRALLPKAPVPADKPIEPLP